MRQGDEHALLDGIRAADGAPDLDALGPALLEPLRRLVRADSVAYNVHALPAGIAWVTAPGDVAVSADRDAFLEFSHQHPIARYVVETHDPGPVAISDFLSLRRFRALELYHDFYRPLEIDRQIGIALGPGVAFTYHRRGSDFDARDREMLALAAPALALAYAQARARTLARRLLAGDAVAACELVELDAELPPGVALWADAQRTLPPPRAPFVVAPLTFHYLRAGAVAERELLLLERAEPAPLDPERLRALGLSRREQEVVERLRRGLTAHEIGRELYISTRTVHHHLERIYRRLGVHSAAAAIAAVS